MVKLRFLVRTYFPKSLLFKFTTRNLLDSNSSRGNNVYSPIVDSLFIFLLICASNRLHITSPNDYKRLLAKGFSSMYENVLVFSSAHPEILKQAPSLSHSHHRLIDLRDEAKSSSIVMYPFDKSINVYVKNETTVFDVPKNYRYFYYTFSKGAKITDAYMDIILSCYNARRLDFGGKVSIAPALMSRSKNLKRFTELRMLTITLNYEDLESVTLAALLVSPNLKHAWFAFNGVSYYGIMEFMSGQPIPRGWQYKLEYYSDHYTLALTRDE